jgi:hypothetical protein
MGLAQAAGAIVLCAVVVLLCRRFAVHVERETAISLGRGLVQMVFVGMVLAVLLHGNLLVGVLILLGMTFAAAVTASRRARDIKGSLLLSFYAIAAGSGVVIAGMLATGTLTTDIAVLVPVGSMIIANAMNACAQSVERFKSDVAAHVGHRSRSLLGSFGQCPTRVARGPLGVEPAGQLSSSPCDATLASMGDATLSILSRTDILAIAAVVDIAMHSGDRPGPARDIPAGHNLSDFEPVLKRDDA